MGGGSCISPPFTSKHSKHLKYKVHFNNHHTNRWSWALKCNSWLNKSWNSKYPKLQLNSHLNNNKVQCQCSCTIKHNWRFRHQYNNSNCKEWAYHLDSLTPPTFHSWVWVDTPYHNYTCI